jgi:hypothetical protein
LLLCFSDPFGGIVETFYAQTRTFMELQERILEFFNANITPETLEIELMAKSSYMRYDEKIAHFYARFSGLLTAYIDACNDVKGFGAVSEIRKSPLRRHSSLRTPPVQSSSQIKPNWPTLCMRAMAIPMRCQSH